MKRTLVLCSALLALHSVFAISGEELAKRQARSVHLKYAPTVPSAESVRGTVRVVETQTNTYYCILGWHNGYCGIQDLGARGRILIFSVWDPVDHEDGQKRTEAEKEELMAKILYARRDVDAARFGGEGTGARTMTQIGWKVGEPVTVRIDAAPDGTNRTAFTCYVKYPKTAEWEKIATISSRLREGRVLGINGIYSFVEDFWRNYHSATLSRRAEYFDIMSRAAGSAEWVRATSARFTADGTPSNAIDAGVSENGSFFLQTGGATTNAHVRLRDRMELAK